MAKDDEDGSLLRRGRDAAVLATMITLLATVAAPAGDGPPVVQPASTTTAPATTTAATQSSTEPSTAAAPAGPVSVATRAATRLVPTTAEIREIVHRGDVFSQIGRVVGSEGVHETIEQTRWWQWWIAILCAIVGITLGRLAWRLFSRLGSKSAEGVRLFRAVAFNSFAGPSSLFLSMAGVGIGLRSLNLPIQLGLAILPAFQVLNVVVVGWLLYNLVDLLTILLTRISRGRQGNLSMMLVPIVRRTTRAALILLLLLFTATNVFNMNVQAILAGVGIAGLAVSLAAQDTLKNLFGSVMIFADQPFLMGDMVKIDAFEGCVEDIGFRSTRIRTADGFLVSIPNAKVADAAVTNLSRRKAIRRVMDVALPYDTTPAQVDEALRILRGVVADAKVAGELDPRHEHPLVALDEFRPNGMRIRVAYWYRVADPTAYAEHSERINRLVLERFAAAQIRFAMST